MKNTLSKSLWISFCAFCITSCAIQSDQMTPNGNDPSAGAKKSSGDLYCSTVDIDWWSVACSSDGEVCYWSFMYTETRSECSYQSQAPIALSGGGGMWFDGNLIPAADGRLQAITASTTLTQTQMNQLREELNDFIAYCLQNNIYNQLAARNKKFNFNVDPNMSGLAGYNPNNNSLSFQSVTQINEQNLREELFHGYQDVYYDGGIAQYNNQTGEPNIEFEAKLFKDLVGYAEGHPGQVSGVPYGNAKHTEYTDWLAAMTNYTKYPTVIDLDKYFYFMDAFKQSYSTHNEGTNSNLYPNALINAIKGSICDK